MDIALYRAVETLSLPPRARVPGQGKVELLLPRACASVLSVRLNGARCPSVEMLSSRVVWAEVPPQVAGVPLGELRAEVAVDAVMDAMDQAVLPASIGLGTSVGFCDGEMHALQFAVRSLMMRPGTDTWNPGRGGGLRALRGLLLDPSDMYPAVRKVQMAVDRYNKEASARSRSGRTNTHQVIRMEVLSVRAVSMEQLEATYWGGDGRVPAGVVSRDLAILASIGHDLRGPSGQTRRISSAVTV